MKIQDRYRWEAEKADGTVVTDGGDLAGCVRFSLIPVNGSKVPQHDLVGVPMLRRFCRGFTKVKFNDQEHVPGKLGWVNGFHQVSTPSDCRDIIRPGDMVRQRGPSELCEWYRVIAAEADHLVIDRPFAGRPARCPALRHTPTVPFEYVHCVVCEGFRLYVRSTDGTALVTPQDYELYL